MENEKLRRKYFKFEIEEIKDTIKDKEIKAKEVVNDNGLAVCPQCKKSTLVTDGGCMSCINEDCGFSKCDM